ncbi:MAG: nitroreductase [Alphaproteobacteria bacterium]|nr:nitroreductase [Alphaproteobacteria bacterium]
MSLLDAVPPAPPESAALSPARPSPQTLDLLALRRSQKLMLIGAPGPTDEELEALLRLAGRVPDHGKLGPWRFAIIAGEARERLGAALADLIAGDATMDAARLEAERRRFLQAPVCVMVVSTAAPHPKIPEWEQVLSAGAACFALLVAAHAAGYAGVWLTEWPAYDDRAREVLRLGPGERVAGFVHLGTATQDALERVRADVASRTSRF